MGPEESRDIQFSTAKLPPTVDKNSNSRKSKVILVLIISLIIGFLGGWLGSNSRLHTSTQTSQQVVLNESQLISSIAKKVGPSVVSVNVTSQTPELGLMQPGVQKSAGTGFIISKDGIIVTNRHVVPSGTSNVNVTLSDGTRLTKVAVIGRTNDSDPLDIAFLKIEDAKGKTLQPVKLGDSTKTQVGDNVVAIGNALGQFQNTVTSGIISGHGRRVEATDFNSTESLEDLFQTDAAINAGNSGGPLVNVNGEVIGINTATAGNAQNIGFAIPINNVSGLINSVLKEGKLIRPYLGVRFIPLTDDVAVQLNLSVKRGAYLAPGTKDLPTIVPGSPADKAQLKEGDIITKVNSVSIDENNSLTSLLGRFKVGTTVTLEVIRSGKTIELKATLEAAPNN